uniref:Uncharacterized protein n=1 Tax=Tetranychus urticae TaxID=32264 RepID=T1JR00_TETUR
MEMRFYHEKYQSFKDDIEKTEHFIEIIAAAAVATITTIWFHLAINTYRNLDKTTWAPWEIWNKERQLKFPI